MEKHACCWQQSLTAKQLIHGAKGRKTANTHPEPAFGWVLIGWALGRSLSHTAKFRVASKLQELFHRGDKNGHFRKDPPHSRVRQYDPSPN